MTQHKNIYLTQLLNALLLIILSLLFIPLIVAQETLPLSTSQTTLQQDETEFKDAALSTSAGITPDSPLYFLDNLLDNFATDASNREEKIAEIQEMAKAGKMDAAKKALIRYQQFAKKTEQDISPEQQQQARKSAVAISHVIKEIKNDIPKEQQQEFVTDILSQEEKISTAAKVADKIKTLCETLSKLDPQQYAQTCKISDNENVPQWQRNLDDKLTGEQQQQARAFFKTMSNCMRNPSNCQCDEISIKPFAEKCKVIAPLAAKCNQGDKQACDTMDKDTENIEDLLPPHLQTMMQEVGQEFNKAEFENHMPQECQKANIDPKSSNAREQCESLMFQQNAPKECIDAGVKDHKECGKIMFNIKAPPECKDAGLTGESQNDPRQCEKIMQNLQPKEDQEQQNQNQNQNNQFNNHGQGMGFSSGKNCREIADTTEKLQCLEQFYNQAQQQQNSFAQNQQEFQNQPENKNQQPYPQPPFPENNQNNNPNNYQNNFDPSRAPPECRDTKSPDDCRKIMEEKSRQYQQENQDKYRSENKESANKEYNPNFHGNAIYPSQDQYQKQENRQNCDCRNTQCSQSSYPACEPGSNSCSCRQSENTQNQYPPHPYPQPPYPGDQQPPNMPPSGMEQPKQVPSPNQQPNSNEQQSPLKQTAPPSDSKESSSDSSASSSSSSSSETTPLTGNTIINNKFLKKYWKK